MTKSDDDDEDSKSDLGSKSSGSKSPGSKISVSKPKSEIDSAEPKLAQASGHQDHEDQHHRRHASSGIGSGVNDADVDDDEVTVLPSDYQFLFNKFSYSNLLTQGHLYFRSWDELQYQVLGSLPETQNPILTGGPPEIIHHLPRINPMDRMTSSQSEDER